MKKTIIELKGITKKYKENIALNNISFSVDKGEIIGLIGPNGAGKTTVMRIISGLIINFDGEIKFSKDNQGSVGCIIETPAFYPYLSGYENLKVISNLSGSFDKERIETLLEMIGLKKHMHKKVKAYSLGMRQRLGIAQALLKKPDVLILDEPLNGLDPYGKAEVMNYIKKLAKNNRITVLISSHVLSELEQICEKMIVLNEGNMVKQFVMDEDTAQKYTFESDNLDRLKTFFDSNDIKVHLSTKDSVTVELGNIEPTELIKRLVMDGCDFSKAYEYNKSLDDLFVEYTGGNAK